MGSETSRWRCYDPLRPWQEGDALVFCTGDAEDVDERELDATTAIVLSVPEIDERCAGILVDTIYGRRWCDPWAFIVEQPAGSSAKQTVHGADRVAVEQAPQPVSSHSDGGLSRPGWGAAVTDWMLLGLLVLAIVATAALPWPVGFLVGVALIALVLVIVVWQAARDPR